MKTRTIILALVLCFTAIGVQQAPAQRKKSDEKTLGHNLKSVRQQRREVERNIRRTKAKLRIVKGDIKEVDSRLGHVAAALDSTRSHLAKSRAEQKSLTVELAAAVEQLKVTRERARKRVRELYMQGEGTVVAALSGSSTYSDFLSRRFVFERIARKDRTLFDEYRASRDAVAERKGRADRLVVQIGGLIEDQKDSQAELQDTRDEKGQMLVHLKGQQRSLERMMDELEAEESNIERQIAAYNRGQGRKTNLPAFSGRFSRPVPGGVTSGYGMRYHPILKGKKRRMHTGVDLGARYGAPIHAAADGVVISAGYRRGYGNTVILDHGSGVSTLYAHASRLHVSSGARVRRGQTIASIGSTGLSTGPHLHFEVRRNGKHVNPSGWL